jgi:hypothetical protein
MELQIVSDLHLEFVKSPIANWRSLVNPSAPYLALLGDICELKNKKLWIGFMEKLVPHFQEIFVVNGNHEYYVYNTRNSHNSSTLLDNQRQWVEDQKWTNVHVLDNESFELNDHKILGTTLWSLVPVWAADEVSASINDYRAITVTTMEGTRPIRVDETNHRHERSVRWLWDEISKSELPVIVLTHHAPLMKGTSNPIYEIPHRAMTSAFATDLSGLFKPHVKLWAFGHTHWNADFMFRRTRVYSNPRGYSNTDPCCADYSADKTVVIQ